MLETLDYTILFLSDEGPMLETFNYTIRIGGTLICISTLSMQHTTFISLIDNGLVEFTKLA